MEVVAEIERVVLGHVLGGGGGGSGCARHDDGRELRPGQLTTVV